MTNIDHQKDQFALDISSKAAQLCRDYVRVIGQPYAEYHLQKNLRLLILDAVEFGIQLGGMGMELKK